MTLKFIFCEEKNRKLRQTKRSCNYRTWKYWETVSQTTKSASLVLLSRRYLFVWSSNRRHAVKRVLCIPNTFPFWSKKSLDFMPEKNVGRPILTYFGNDFSQKIRIIIAAFDLFGRFDEFFCSFERIFLPFFFFAQRRHKVPFTT